MTNMRMFTVSAMNLSRALFGSYHFYEVTALIKEYAGEQPVELVVEMCLGDPFGRGILTGTNTQWALARFDIRPPMVVSTPSRLFVPGRMYSTHANDLAQSGGFCHILHGISHEPREFQLLVSRGHTGRDTVAVFLRRLMSAMYEFRRGDVSTSFACSGTDVRLNMYEDASLFACYVLGAKSPLIECCDVAEENKVLAELDDTLNHTVSFLLVNAMKLLLREGVWQYVCNWFRYRGAFCPPVRVGVQTRMLVRFLAAVFVFLGMESEAEYTFPACVDERSHTDKYCYGCSITGRLLRQDWYKALLRGWQGTGSHTVCHLLREWRLVVQQYACPASEMRDLEGTGIDPPSLMDARTMCRAMDSIVLRRAREMHRNPNFKVARYSRRIRRERDAGPRRRVRARDSDDEESE